MKHTHIYALLFGISASSLLAENAQFTGGGDGTSWDDADNWTNSGTPLTGGTPTADDNLNNMVGHDVAINNGVNAVLDAGNNAGVNGGKLTINTGGSLTVDTSFEVSRNSTDLTEAGTVVVDGGTFTVGTDVFIRHYGGAGEGTLEVKNGGAANVRNFRSDGGVSRLIIDGAGSTVTTTSNSTFANNDTATQHLQISSGGSLATGGRDYWGGVGTTMSIDGTGSKYIGTGDQLGLSHRAGGDSVLTISNGGLLQTDATVYSAHNLNSSTTITIESGGTFQTTNATRDFQAATGVDSETSITVKGTGNFLLSRHLDADSGNAIDFNIEGDDATITVGGNMEVDNAATTTQFILGEEGASIVSITGNLTVTGGILIVDLAAYDVGTNGDSTQLFAYGSSLTGTFTESFLNGTATLDYGTSGEVWLTDISVIPEPGTYALLAGLTGLAVVALRRRG